MNSEKREWHPMPCGTRLELGDTGFWIFFRQGYGETPYSAFDPEGRQLLNGFSLTEIKFCLERMARERDEFKPRAMNTNYGQC